MFSSIVQLFVLFVIGHYAADYLQTGFTAKFKAPDSIRGWQHILFGHASIQAVAIIVAMNYLGYDKSTTLAIATIEMILHSLIDVGKCKDLFGFHTDQFLHIGCKAVYVALVMLPQLSWLRIGIIALLVLMPICSALLLTALKGAKRKFSNGKP